jgi:hypothetical protein
VQDRERSFALIWFIDARWKSEENCSRQPCNRRALMDDSELVCLNHWQAS